MGQPVRAATIPATPPFAPGALIWRRYGPLPVWGYVGILLGGLLIWMYLRRGKATDQATAAQVGSDASTIAANTPKSNIFLLPQTGLAGPAGPAGPAGGVGPAGPAGPGAPAPTETVPAAPAGSGRDNPPGEPVVPAGRYVTVKKYTTVNPPWESTLSGIAQHFNTTVAWLQSKNGISNPNLIHPGDIIKIDWNS